VTRLTLDTNVVASGLLWDGASAALIDGAREGRFQLFTSMVLISELARILRRTRLARAVASSGYSVDELVLGYAELAVVIEPAVISPVILRDPADDHVLACALAAGADIIVSGDGDLLELKAYQSMPVLAPARALDYLAKRPA
jgi:uncharacterized protein